MSLVRVLVACGIALMADVACGAATMSLGDGSDTLSPSVFIEAATDAGLHLLTQIKSKGLAPPGDANGDGRVDDSDAAILASHWQQPSAAGRSGGDFNGDGRVNDQDVLILNSHWDDDVNDAMPIAEPATQVLLVGGFLAWVLRRHRVA